MFLQEIFCNEAATAHDYIYEDDLIDDEEDGNARETRNGSTEFLTSSDMEPLDINPLKIGGAATDDAADINFFDDESE